MKEFKARSRRVTLQDPVGMTLEKDLTEIRNVSMSGCLVRTNRWFRVDSTNFELTIHTGESSPINSAGRIVRAKMVPGKSGLEYEIGLKFDRDHGEHKQLQAWLSKVLENETNTIVI